jgi:hypothetical protein
MIEPIRVSVLCFLLAAFTHVQSAAAQSQSFNWDPADPPSPGNPSLGSGVAVSERVAAIGAPNFELYDDPDYQHLAWQGLVNVYETNAGRTRWTLLTILHLDDSSPENRALGKAIAADGRRLVVAANATLHIYEYQRGYRGFRLADTVILRDATISESGPIELARGVLAVGVLDNDTGRGSVRIFQIGPNGKARAVARIPSRHSDGSTGAISLAPDARALAVSMVENGRRGVHIFESHGKALHGKHCNDFHPRDPHCIGWRRTAIVRAPSPDAAGFGASVALSRFGLVVGAPYENQQYDYENNLALWAGAVYVFRKAQQRWFLVQRLATNEPDQPSYGSVQLGTEIVTNGPLVWITAPFAHEQWSSEIQVGSALLYRWSAGSLEYVVDGPYSFPDGGIDMSRRYVIEGDIYNGARVTNEGAHIVDLRSLVPATPGSGDPEEAGVAEYPVDAE